MTALHPSDDTGILEAMTYRLLLLAPALLLAGCLSAIAANESVSRVRLNQVAGLGQVRLVPLQVLEDSRCPQGVQCVWAGQVRVRVSVSTPLGEHLRTVTAGQPEQIGGGTLLLETVTPRAAEGVTIPRSDYSFVFRYTVPSRV